MISMLKEGPERKANGCSRSGPSASAIAWPISCCVGRYRPFAVEQISTSGGMASRWAASHSGVCWHGRQWMISCTPAIAAARSVVALTFGGRGKSER